METIWTNPPTPAPKCPFTTCPGHQPQHNPHLGEHRRLKARSEMPVGIRADKALGPGTFGLLSGSCHTKKETVPAGCCSWEGFGSSAGLQLADVPALCMCVYTQGKNETAASHTTGRRKSASSPGAKEEHPSLRTNALSHCEQPEGIRRCESIRHSARNRPSARAAEARLCVEAFQQVPPGAEHGQPPASGGSPPTAAALRLGVY